MIENKQGEALAKTLVEVPRVDAPATVHWLTDSHGATVIEVSPSGAKVTVREDRAIRTDKNGWSEQQSYTHERDPDGKVHVFYRDGRGQYRNRKTGIRLNIGERRTYRDPSF